MRFLYGQTVNYFKMEILGSQSCANFLRLSSLKGWVRDSAFSASGFLIPTPQIRYISILLWYKLKGLSLVLCNYVLGKCKIRCHQQQIVMLETKDDRK